MQVEGRTAKCREGWNAFPPKVLMKSSKATQGKSSFFFILLSLDIFLVFRITHTQHRKFEKYTHKAFIKHVLDEECNETWGKKSPTVPLHRGHYFFLFF